MWPSSDDTMQQHKPGTKRNNALLCQTMIDDAMALARDAGMDETLRALDVAYEKATDAIKEMNGE